MYSWNFLCFLLCVCGGGGRGLYVGHASCINCNLEPFQLIGF